MNEEKIYFSHGKLEDGTRYTVAGEMDYTMDVLCLGVSVCSARDQFCKRTGRAKSGGRLQAKTETPGKFNIGLTKSMVRVCLNGKGGKVFTELTKAAFSNLKTADVLREKVGLK